MSESTGNNQHGTSEPEGSSAPFSPEKFPPEKRDRMMEIWELAGRSRPVSPDLTGQEVEQALSEVHRRISINKKKDRRSKARHPAEKIGKRRSSSHWRWWAVAAVILLVLGAGLLLTPQTVTSPRGDMVSVTASDGSICVLISFWQIECSTGFDVTRNDT